VKIALLDGGMGQEIVKRSQAAPDPLWSIGVMMDRPEIVRDAHAAFIAAGARVICVNTYAATPTRLARDGAAHSIEAIYERAFALAREAVEARPDRSPSIQIAGCLPPLVASYVAEAGKGYDESLEEYRRIVALQADHADLFLIETMSNVTEALAALDAAGESGKPRYLGLTIADDGGDRLRSGEPLSDALPRLAERRPDGILLNCSYPEAITKAMPLLAMTGLRFGAYANAFRSITGLTPGGTAKTLERREEITPDVYVDHVLDWIDRGASIVGGCCEVGPEHIAVLHDRLVESGHEPTTLRWDESSAREGDAHEP
jgi:homocysteine S-methyltransferase